MSLHVAQPERLLDDLLSTAQVALEDVGATEAEAELLKRDVLESLCMFTDDSMDSAARRHLREHRRLVA